MPTKESTQLPVWRDRLAHVFLVATFFVPLIATSQLISSWVNQLGALFQMCFALALLPETVHQIQATLRRSKLLQIALALLGLTVVAWLIYAIPVVSINQTWTYLAFPIFVFALVAWLQGRANAHFRYVYRYKLASVLLASVWIGIAIIQRSIAEESKISLFVEPPVYRHIRHLNMDLGLIVPLVLFFWPVHGQLSQRLAYAATMAVLGYFSVWSAGRGEVLSLLVFGGLLLAFRTTPFADKRLWLPVFWFLLGGCLVILLGETYFLNPQVERSVGEGSLAQISSGRNNIWLHTIKSLMEQGSVLFGAGPDATRRLGTLGGDYIQPHNFVVQLFAEFGLVGFTAICLGLGQLSLVAVRSLRHGDGFTLEKTVSALFLSTLVYALFDGQFYHTLQLTMVAVLCAYLTVVNRSRSSAGGKRRYLNTDANSTQAAAS